MTGAVADAVAFADWLGKLGVPEKQVLFHAAPTAQSQRLLKARSPSPATEKEIKKSVARLEKVTTGERLIVYLAGHGIYEPSSHRLFLLEDFTEDDPVNMGIDLYVNRFLSMAFKRQFLFLDGCQNLPYSPSARQRIQPASFATGFTPRPENVLVACFAASQEQLDVPFQVRIPVGYKVTANCLLRKGSTVGGETEYLVPVSAETPVTFNLEPAARPQDSPGVVLQTVRADGQTVGPDGSIMANQFSYAEVAEKLGLTHELTSGQEMAPDVLFQHHETGPEFQLARSSGEAAIDSRRLAAEWARAIQDVTPDDIGVATFLVGSPAEGTRPRLSFRFDPGGAAALAGPVATRELVWIGRPEHAPPEPLYEASIGESPPGTHSLAALEKEPEVEIEPGHALVRVDLPWGSWSTTVEAAPASSYDVQLPSVVGEPPLRVRLADQLGRQGSFVFGVRGRAPAISLRNGVFGRRRSRFTSVGGGSAHWAVAAPKASWIARPDAVPIATAGGWSFPFLAGRSFGFERTAGYARVEPLSAVPSTAWDVLLSRGLLDALPPREGSRPHARQWNDVLLGIAGAYAVYALPPDEENERLLATVLTNLGRLAKGSIQAQLPDVDLLRAALSARGEEQLKARDRQRLERRAERLSVPALRWGVPLAIRLIEDGFLAGEPYDRWAETLSRVEANLSPLSVWTAWREPGRRAASV